MTIQTGTGKMRKSPALALTAILVWLVLISLLVWPWIVRLDATDWMLSAAGHFSGLVWWLMLLWAFHHLAYQIAGLFYREKPQVTRSDTPEIAILYTTRDDFNPNCCRSCVEQVYPRFRVLICDDSENEIYRALISDFCSAHPQRCTLVRRPDCGGFKAGNLNNAVKTEVTEEWVLLVDADQKLPEDYLRTLVSVAPKADSSIGFVQGAQKSAIDPQSSHLQQAMAPGAQGFCQRDLPLRTEFGFVPMLGHGTLIPTETLRSCGGFPEVVSEDFAFAMQAAGRGLHGRYVRNAVSEESFPHDFPAFVIRLRKYASGTAELFRRAFPTFLFANHNTALVAKWDLFLMLGWYLLMPFVVINGFVAAYVCHRYWTSGIPILIPMLPYLFTWLVLSALAIVISASDNVRQAFRFYFWSGGIFLSALPLASCAFVRHLFRDPVFERTPKNGQSEGLSRIAVRCTPALGLAALILAAVWYSPFSFVLAGHGVAYLSFPLYAHLCRDSARGRFARAVIYLPGLLLLAAVGAVWYWAYS